MTVYLENETGRLDNAYLKELFDKVVKASAEYLGIPFEITVNILVTDNENIHEINRSERGIDRPTDVLSFPMLEFDKAGDFSFISRQDSWLFDPEADELLMGDIVISLDTAERQAADYGHSLERELAFLCTHSMLHLSGFDHMEDSERENMEMMQREILDKLGIVRD